VKIEKRKEIMRTESGRAGEREDRLFSLSLAPSLSLALALSLSLSLSLTTFAQSGRKPQGQQGQQQGEKPMVRIETREVAVPIIAYDSDGNYVNDMGITSTTCGRKTSWCWKRERRGR